MALLYHTVVCHSNNDLFSTVWETSKQNKQELLLFYLQSLNDNYKMIPTYNYYYYNGKHVELIKQFCGILPDTQFCLFNKQANYLMANISKQVSKKVLWVSGQFSKLLFFAQESNQNILRHLNKFARPKNVSKDNDDFI